MAAAILLSLVGATLAVAMRHYTSQNWTPELQDVWYYVLSGGISVTLALLGYDTATILTATAGINTPLALVKTGMDKYADKKAGSALNATNIDALKAQIAKMEAEARKKG